MKYLLALYLVLSLCGCAALGDKIKSLAGTAPQSQKAATVDPSNAYSKVKNYKSGNLPQRKYGRMNRDRFVEEAKVGEESGSLWVTEGQSSYLFSQNQKRLEGDVLNVLIEDQAKEQLNSKIGTISNLLRSRKEAAEAKRKAAMAKASTTKNQPANAKQEEPGKKAAIDEEKLPSLSTDKVPSRVTAAYPDGSYRIKGTKTMLIENKEFQVLITGLVRGNDIKDDSVASSKLLDAKYDIVSQRRMR